MQKRDIRKLKGVVPLAGMVGRERQIKAQIGL